MAEFGGDGSVLAGGMSLGPMLNMRLARPAAVIDINPIGALSGIGTSDDGVETGALCRQVDALGSALVRDAVPLLAEALPYVGHFQTRNRGTLGGSICHADPSAEIPLALVTLGGGIVLRRRGGSRIVPASDFFEGIFATAREPEELLTALRWPRAEAGTGWAFEEIAQRHGDFAIAAVAAAASVDADGRIAAAALGLGGIEDRPRLAEFADLAGLPATPRDRGRSGGGGGGPGRSPRRPQGERRLPAPTRPGARRARPRNGPSRERAPGHAEDQAGNQAADRGHGERPGLCGIRRIADPVERFPAPRAQAVRDPCGLRARGMRGLHGQYRRARGALLPASRRAGRRCRDRHRRGARGGRGAEPAARGVPAPPCAAMRVLHAGAS